MIDGEAFLSKLIPRDVEALDLDEDVSIAPDIDVDQLEHLPAILFTLIGDGQVANGDGLWNFILTLSTFGEGMDQAKRFARIGYDIAHAWNGNSAATVIDVDGEPTWVSDVSDIDVPSRLAAAQIPGRNVVQYVGSFGLALRN